MTSQKRHCLISLSQRRVMLNSLPYLGLKGTQFSQEIQVEASLAKQRQRDLYSAVQDQLKICLETTHLLFSDLRKMVMKSLLCLETNLKANHYLTIKTHFLEIKRTYLVSLQIIPQTTRKRLIIKIIKTLKTLEPSTRMRKRPRL